MITIDIKQEIRGLVENSLPLMEGREKGELPKGQILTICEYGFLEGENGEFVVFNLKEDKQHFYFGGTVLTDLFHKLESKYTSEVLAELMAEGLPFRATNKKSKNKREYVNIELYPTV